MTGKLTVIGNIKIITNKVQSYEPIKPYMYVPQLLYKLKLLQLNHRKLKKNQDLNKYCR